MSKELRECPFCQSIAEHYSFSWRRHTVRCRYCLADCGEHDTPERAAFVWNTRPAEDALKAEVERLKSTIEKVKKELITHRDHAIQSINHNGKTYQIMNQFLMLFCNNLIEMLNSDTSTPEKGGEDES